MTICVFFGQGDYTGASRMGASTARALRSAGHSVLTVCGPRPKSKSDAVADILRKDGFDVHEVGAFSKGIRLDLFLFLRRLLISKRVDCIVTFFVTIDTRYAALAAMGLGIPVIASVQIEIGFYGNWMFQLLKKFLFWFVYEFYVDLSICTSTRIVNDLSVRYGIRMSRIILVPNGIDIDKFDFMDATTRRSCSDLIELNDNHFNLINVGRIDPQKGQAVLLRALNHCVIKGLNVSVSFVGDANYSWLPSVEYYMKLKEFAVDARIDKHVKFLGWRNDISLLNRSCDCYVHSSIWEGAPLAVLEAMASGCPVIFTDCAGWPYGFVNDKHGLIVPAGNVGDLSAAIGKIYNMSVAQRSEMGKNARMLVEGFYNINLIGPKYVAACHAVAAPGVVVI